MNKKRTSIPSLCDGAGNLVTDARENADALNSLFVTCFNPSSPQLSSHNIPKVKTSYVVLTTLHL